jgi:hypothetical protein
MTARELATAAVSRDRPSVGFILMDYFSFIYMIFMESNKIKQLCDVQPHQRSCIYSNLAQLCSFRDTNRSKEESCNIFFAQHQNSSNNFPTTSNAELTTCPNVIHSYAEQKSVPPLNAARKNFAMVIKKAFFSSACRFAKNSNHYINNSA